MGGQIDFILAGHSESMVAATEAASLATRRLRISVEEVNAAFARANAGCGSASAFTAADLRSKSKALGGTLSGLALNASMFMGSDVQSVVYPAMLIGKELKGLSAAMKLAGISLGTAAAAGTVFTASLIAITAAYSKFKEMREAQKIEEESGKNLADNIAARQKKLFGLMDVAEGAGMMSPTETRNERLKQQYAINDSVRDEALKALAGRLRGMGMLPNGGTFWNNQEAFMRMQNMMTASATSPFAAQREQIYQQTADRLAEGMKLALAAGKPFEPLREAIMAARDTALSGVNAAERDAAIAALKEDDMKSARERSGIPVPGLTDWEKIGLVRNGGGVDHLRNTADNTRAMLAEQKTTNRLLANTGNSFANL